MRLGASDYLARPVDLAELNKSLKIASRTSHLTRENRRLTDFVAGQGQAAFFHVHSEVFGICFILLIRRFPVRQWRKKQPEC
jgi:hypothetical protein